VKLLFVGGTQKSTNPHYDYGKNEAIRGYNNKGGKYKIP